MRDNPFVQLVIWLLTPAQILQGLLLIAVLASCIGVSFAAFETRQHYAQLQDLVNETDTLDSEYEKLLLEQSAWAGYARIDEVSRVDLEMRIPEGEQVVVVTP